MASGWITLDRTLLDHWLWQTDEPFDVRSAWVDLIFLMNHSDGKIRYRGKTEIIKKGQHKTSIRKLAARWHWSESKVRRFLDDLEKDEMITRISTENGTLLTLINYGVRQKKQHTYEGTDDRTDSSTHRRTDDRTDSRLTKNNKRIIKNEKINNTPSAEPEEEDDEDDRFAGMTDDEITAAIIKDGWENGWNDDD